jgi:hypothetical protein
MRELARPEATKSQILAPPGPDCYIAGELAHGAGPDNPNLTTATSENR